MTYQWKTEALLAILVFVLFLGGHFLLTDFAEVPDAKEWFMAAVLAALRASVAAILPGLVALKDRISGGTSTSRDN